MRKPPNPGAFVFPRPCVGVGAECCRVLSCATGCDNAGGDGSPASCSVSDDDVRMRYGVYGDGPCPALISQGIVGELGGIRDSGVCSHAAAGSLSHSWAFAKNLPTGTLESGVSRNRPRSLLSGVYLRNAVFPPNSRKCVGIHQPDC